MDAPADTHAPKHLRCRKCGLTWKSHSASTRCRKCNHEYVEWLDYAEWEDLMANLEE
jgi:rubrerythrin